MNEIRHFYLIFRAVKFLGNQEERIHMHENLLAPGKVDICITSFEMVIKGKTAPKRFSWWYIIIDKAHHAVAKSVALGYDR